MCGLHSPVVWLLLAALPALCRKLHIIASPASGELSCRRCLFLFVRHWGTFQAHYLHWLWQQKPTTTTIVWHLSDIEPVSSVCIDRKAYRSSQDCFFFSFCVRETDSWWQGYELQGCSWHTVIISTVCKWESCLSFWNTFTELLSGPQAKRKKEYIHIHGPWWL